MLSMKECPICGSESRQVDARSAQGVREAYETYYGQSYPGDDFYDYAQLRCSQCAFEFFDPMRPGSNAFYKWMTLQKGYYPSHRWEWPETLAMIKAGGGKTVLEVGCGAGDFMALACQQLPANRIVGVDTTATSVEKCRARGLEVFCGDLDSFLESIKSTGERFDVAVAFHCLEHVPDPKGFVRAMQRVLNAKGKIFLSTPYSPMSFEEAWFDPLNHPPHHLGRWNVKAYRALAQAVGMEVSFHMAPPTRPRDSFILNIKLHYFGSSLRANRWDVFGFILTHPLAAWRLWKQARRRAREQVEGMPLSDGVLVRLKMK